MKILQDAATLEQLKNQINVKIHVGIAEQGKIHALNGNYPEALRYYRKAIEMAVVGGDEAIYTRHYVWCMLEALELNGLYEPVLQYCNQVMMGIDKSISVDINVQDIVDVWQRKGVVLLKMGKEAEGLVCFKKALEYTSTINLECPLAQALLFMASSGLVLDLRRIEAEQRRLGYFIVQEASVDSSIAITLPDES